MKTSGHKTRTFFDSKSNSSLSSLQHFIGHLVEPQADDLAG